MGPDSSSSKVATTSDLDLDLGLESIERVENTIGNSP